MARLPRIYIPGCAHHVIQRGHNRHACFFDDADYKAYLGKLKDSSEKYKVAIHAYVLMTNHIHLLLTPSDKHGVSRFMQSLGRSYVGYVNHVYQRTGTLWEGRYKSTLVDSDSYLLTVYRYIELNPVRANMVEHASEYPWSSYHANALGKKIRLLTTHPTYCLLGSNDAERQEAYRELFRTQMSEKDKNDIIEATDRGWVLGDNRFKQQIEATVGRKISPIGRGGDRRSQAFKYVKVR